MFVAAALASSPMEAPAKTSSMKMEMAADAPCMDMMDMGDQDQPSKCPSKCCDGKACPDMSRCAHAQPALAAVVVPMIHSSIEHNAPAVQAPIAAVRPPTSLLRPPISFHS
ncbi:hypothetical protein CJD38_09385 [Stenotrophobium rhamnosiphilum]|uniref:Uncharacterized protein n=2 Tax=Stenotrophobium rhamnosiphilum TaxID=2029166 RepID=A0A2T5MG34_9GAMM|nr:hypothetical protein CJD38_09385 [Stenotrophobium rhamnosiphilum]